MKMKLVGLTSHTAAKPLTVSEQLPLHPVQSITGTITARGLLSGCVTQVPPGSMLLPLTIRAFTPVLYAPVEPPDSLLTTCPTDSVPEYPLVRLLFRHDAPVHPSASESQLPGPTELVLWTAI